MPISDSYLVGILISQAYYVLFQSFCLSANDRDVHFVVAYYAYSWLHALRLRSAASVLGYVRIHASRITTTDLGCRLRRGPVKIILQSAIKTSYKLWSWAYYNYILIMKTCRVLVSLAPRCIVADHLKINPHGDGAMCPGRVTPAAGQTGHGVINWEWNPVYSNLRCWVLSVEVYCRGPRRACRSLLENSSC